MHRTNGMHFEGYAEAILKITATLECQRLQTADQEAEVEVLGLNSRLGSCYVALLCFDFSSCSVRSKAIRCSRVMLIVALYTQSRCSQEHQRPDPTRRCDFTSVPIDWSSSSSHSILLASV